MAAANETDTIKNLIDVKPHTADALSRNFGAEFTVEYKADYGTFSHNTPGIVEAGISLENIDI